MIQQLRIYEIFEANKIRFHQRFRRHAARIMRERYRFRFVAMWETRFGERTGFACLLEWSDEAAKAAAWSARSRIGCWYRRIIRRRQVGAFCRVPELVQPLALVGQISFGLAEIMSSEKSSAIENISLYQKRKLGYTLCHPVPLRGASAVVTNEGRVAVDAGCADKRTAWTRTAKTCGPDVPWLASTVATVHGSPGRARYKP